MEQRSEVYCTNCGGRFIATLDLSLNGNHEITCPLCFHIHYRVVLNGVVTEDRWRSSAGPTFIAATSLTVSFNMQMTNSTNPYLISSWLNRSDYTLITTA